MSRLFCNGMPADAPALAAALVNYGHFTSLQVRGGAVQGWARHVRRLQQASGELFDAVLDAQQLREWLKEALVQCGVDDASVRITVFSRAFDFRQPLRAVPVDVLVAVSAPAHMPATARAVLPVRHVRVLPHLKHVATFDLFHHRRQAMQAGFDDALFFDDAGRVSEGTTWNLALWDGAQVVWPQAAALRGITEQLLMAALAQAGQAQCQQEVGVAALAGYRGAVAGNATGLWPLARIGEVGLEDSVRLLEILQPALRQVPWERL